MKYLVGLLLLTASVVFAAGFSPGENLISSFTPEHRMYRDYQPYEKSDASSRSYLWVSQEFGNDDTYKLDIKLGLGSADLSRLQEILNKPGIDQCKDFTSADLGKGQSNGYPQLTWETTCDTGSKKIRVLHKAIAGNDSMYLARKFWYREATASAVREWKELFQQTYLCDTRKAEHPCPEGYK